MELNEWLALALEDAGFPLRAEKLCDKIIEDAFEVTNGNVFVHVQSFKLVKHRGMRHVNLPSVTFGNINPADRKFPFFHFTNLPV